MTRLFSTLTVAVVLSVLSAAGTSAKAQATQPQDTSAHAKQARRAARKESAKEERKEERAEKAEKHPHIHRALRELEDAKRELQSAAHDFGGHRVDAIKALDEAEKQLRLALQYDKN